MNFLNRFFRSRISVRKYVSDNVIVLIQQRVIHAPGIYTHAYRDFANFFTFLKSVLDFLEKSVKLPAKLSVLFYHSIFKTMYLFQFHLSVLQMSQDQSSA